jgi:hypothetical protein
MSTIKVVDVSTFDEFVRAITDAGSIRLVKLEDYGFTSPVEKDGMISIQPMVRLVATAFDKRNGTIYRWQETTEARRAVNIRSATGSGAPEGVVLMEKDRVRELLQLEGFSVEKGEWTLAAVETLLGRTGT